MIFHLIYRFLVVPLAILFLICLILSLAGPFLLSIFNNFGVIHDSDIETRPILMEKLQSLRELHTAISSCQVIVTATQEKTMLGLGVGETKLLYVAVGVVRAGVDFSQLDENSISIQGKSAKVTLPAADILDSKIDVEKSFVYDVRQSTLGPRGFDLQGEAEKQALREVEEAAMGCGVLELAQEQAALTIKSLLELVGYDVVEVNVVSGVAEAAAGGCGGGAVRMLEARPAAAGGRWQDAGQRSGVGLQEAGHGQRSGAEGAGGTSRAAKRRRGGRSRRQDAGQRSGAEGRSRRQDGGWQRWSPSTGVCSAGEGRAGGTMDISSI